MAQKVKCLPAMRETRVRSLGWEDPLEKEMATHSSTLAWKISWMEEPGGLQSTGSQSGHNYSDLAHKHACTTFKGLLWCLSGKESTCQCKRLRFDPWVRKIPWRRKWQPTPVFLPGESHGRRSLVGFSPWGRKESDTTERLHSLTHSGV